MNHTTAVDAHSQRLGTFEEAWLYIDKIDFTLLRSKLLDPDEGTGDPIDVILLDFAESQYRRWLVLLRKYENQGPLSPTGEMDLIWHAHILDTRSYHEMCGFVFGHYLHHNPYFGMAGDSDYSNLVTAVQWTDKCYEDTFHEPLLNFVPDSDRCLNG